MKIIEKFLQTRMPKSVGSCSPDRNKELCSANDASRQKVISLSNDITRTVDGFSRKRTVTLIK